RPRRPPAPISTSTSVVLSHTKVPSASGKSVGTVYTETSSCSIGTSVVLIAAPIHLLVIDIDEYSAASHWDELWRGRDPARNFLPTVLRDSVRRLALRPYPATSPDRRGIRQ